MNSLNVEMFNEALKLEKENDVESALELYREILKEKPDHLESWLNSGAIYFKQGNEDEAILCYEKALAIRNDIRALYNLGLVHYKISRVDSALGYFQKCIAIDATFLPACLLTGYILTEMNNPRGAIAVLQGALQVHRENESLLLSLAIAFHADQKNPLSAEVLRKILLKNPHNGAALRLQARLSVQDSVTKSSIENYRKLIQDAPEIIEFEAILDRQENKSIRENILQRKNEIARKDVKTNADYLDLSLMSFISGNANAAMNYLLYAVKEP